MKGQVLLVLATSFMAATLFATPASADGLQHFNSPEVCTYYENVPITYCTSSSGQYQVTTTTSGQMSITGKGVFAYSFAGPSIDARHTEEYKIHSLYKQGDRFVEGGKLAITETCQGDHLHLHECLSLRQRTDYIRPDSPKLQLGSVLNLTS